MGFRKNEISKEKELPDVSGYNGMQKLFHVDDAFDGEKQMQLINYYLANKWKVVDIKKANNGDFILLEYFNED